MSLLQFICNVIMLRIFEFFNGMEPEVFLGGVVRNRRKTMPHQINGIIDGSIRILEAILHSSFFENLVPGARGWLQSKMADNCDVDELSLEEEKSKQNGQVYFEKVHEVLTVMGNDIEEFDVIPSVKPVEGKSLPYIRETNRLGVFSWCVKELFSYTYEQLKATDREMLTRDRDELKQKGVHLLALSRVCLLLHSEDYTVWNIRKLYVSIQATEELWRNELAFTELVLTKQPRSAETFTHRRWLLKRGHLQWKYLKTVDIQKEFELTLACAERYPCNYVSWDHRCWLSGYFVQGDVTWLETELISTKDWLWRHVSDNCVYHYRQHVLKLLLESCSKMKVLYHLREEWTLTLEVSTYYPFYETLWYHRRFLIAFSSSHFPSKDCRSADICRELLTRLLNDLGCQTCSSEDRSRGIKKVDTRREAAKGSSSTFLRNDLEISQEMMEKVNGTSVQGLRQCALLKSHLSWLRQFYVG
ncbi:protein prenyltransferase alpha subunit repeat-containing protein 1-B-like [Xenia sp. Carnegie-2017]|uniref:protein prenyltransferase alpha subunit repeat-containing protein 1-B-like n=1 Tax=Xenia sp. Carnegie-2017 TaxID=2897299 RepID=UPI001F0484E5|nr:protein prenyltransferase alpha subunit repeat-containing protein 1-B-like [Xenia sp. Carnegie-2017]